MSNYSDGSLNAQDHNTSWAKIFSYVPSGSRVLDIGCSSGELGMALKKEKKCTVYGIELDPGDLARAKKSLDGAYGFNIENETIPEQLLSQKFDVIILADVIEHLVNPIQSLAKTRALLKDGGILIFSIPNMSHMSVRLQLLGGDFTYNETGLLDKTHLHFYNFKEVQRVLGGAGYQIIKNNANTLTYSPSFIKKKLASLGLKDDGFIERSKTDIDAQSFQFVGYCKPLKGDHKPKDVVLSTTTPEKELTIYIENLATDNLALLKKAKQSIQKVVELQAEVSSLNETITALHDRPVHVLVADSLRKIAKSPKKLNHKGK